MGSKVIDPWDDPHAQPLEPKKRGRKASEKLFTIAIKKDAVGWRIIFAEVPESTIDNHAIERTEPDVFDMMVGKIESRLMGLIYR